MHLQNEQIVEYYNLLPPVTMFSLPGRGSNNRTVGVHTGAGDFVWKTYQTQRTQAAILYEHHLLAWLNEQSLPFSLPVPVKTREGGTVCQTSEGWKALSPWLPGEPLDPRNLAQVRAMGVALGDLHKTFALFPGTPSPGIPDFGDFVQFQPPITDPFQLTPEQLGLPAEPKNERLFSLWRADLNFLSPFLAGNYQRLPRQVTHRDFDPSNTLMNGENQVTGLLDFEFAGLDARALDLAVSLEFTMRVWENDFPWETARAFCQGYRERNRGLIRTEVEAIPMLIRLRDVVSTISRIGRALINGESQSIPGRIQRTHRSFQWLDRNADRLVELAGEALL